MAVTLEEGQVRASRLLEDLAGMGELQLESGHALVSLIGNRINHTAGLARDIFGELTDINVRMICQGASVHNICFLIEEARLQEALGRLHRRFIEAPQGG